MNLWQRTKMAWKVIRNKATQVDENFSKWFRGGRSIFLSGNNSKLASNETIFAAVSRLSNSMATLPLKFFKEFSPVYTELSDLISNSPNNNMTSFDFIRILETHRNVHGNGYALKMYGRHYSVTSLVILDPTCVEPVVEQETGELWYEINGEKGRYYVHNLDMIHIKHIHTTQNGYKGISPIDVLRNTIDFDREVREFSLSQMEGGIHASFILKYAAHIGKEKKAEILENFKSFYKDNGGVLIQESGVEIDPITRNFIDTKVFEVEKITRTRVATVFNMPVSMLGETDGASYSSMEQMSLEFVTYTLLPIVRQYEQEFNRKLLTPQERQRGLYFKFNLSALLRGDTSTRGEFYFKMVRSGVFKPNEIRAWEELPPEVGGEKLYISGDLYPIDTPPSERKGVKASEQEVLGI
ncbi:HK97 family phage portal protein [Aneurinibacillus soli]|uniref:Phage portal protein n=1 Tax=Aneurinibacillus soli TaxID=1500254 RepID=A0A0U4WG05_9BACL|nr:phage portal protein [Aneurinibacillus soli]PYE63443.1 HK97 family phage portal protein [Aneurinibacillus soli]BAU27625.1 Phage portal protein [Aneurinibacillus soli]